MKAWVDLDDQTQKAKLARHVGALANHGGGYLVFGFNDDLTHDQNRPSSLEKYNRDTFAGIAKRYLTPIFQCDVFSVTHSNGNEFSVVRVPGHKDVPIAAKADGPQDRSEVGSITGRMCNPGCRFGRTPSRPAHRS